MAEIRPFRAIRYDPALLDSMEQVIAPPYDVLDTDDQDNLYNLSPYNVIRLEYGKTYHDDDIDHNRYSRAAQTLSRWLDEGILHHEKQKLLYLYEQSFKYGASNYCRRGVVAALKVEPYSCRQVLPHEQTFSAPKADRLELLKKTRTNISPIFTLFPDPDTRISNLFEEISRSAPLFTAKEQSGQVHRIHKIDNPRLQDQIVRYIKPQALLIADGHHRYETALQYRELYGGPAADYVLAILVSTKDPGLLMLPTHRLIQNLTEPAYAELLAICKDNFELVTMSSSVSLVEQDFQAEWSRLTDDERAFAIITPEFKALLVPKPGRQERCGVELLHALIIDPFLARPVRTGAESCSLSFPHELETIRLAMLGSTRASVAFILNPLPVDLVYRLAVQGTVMPQKTTYFYPKMPGGLLLRNLDLD